MKFTYKDVSIKIPSWPFYGEVVFEVYTTSITEADKLFKDIHPNHCNKKGMINNTITVTSSN